MTGFQHSSLPRTRPLVDAHFVDAKRTILELEMLWIPLDMRGKGEGRKFYEAWEASLPPAIKEVRLFAADTGNGNMHGFWQAMGYDFSYAPDEFGDVDDIPYESRYRMHKGVNGRPTREPWIWEPEEPPAKQEIICGGPAPA